MRIKELREQKGITQAELAKAMNLSPSTIGMYEQGRREPNMETAAQFARFFNVSLEKIVGIPVNIHADTSRAVDQPVAMIPVYGRIVAGEPREAVEEILGYTAIPDKNERAEDFFALKVFGASMQPTFLDGDTVIIRKQPTVDNGQVAVVLIENEEATVKRVFIAPDGITISADNPAVFRQRFYTNEEIELLPVRILGHVVGFFRDV